MPTIDLARHLDRLAAATLADWDDFLTDMLRWAYPTVQSQMC
jgi:hypothetical protein